MRRTIELIFIAFVAFVARPTAPSRWFRPRVPLFAVDHRTPRKPIFPIDEKGFPH